MRLAKLVSTCALLAGCMEDPRAGKGSGYVAEALVGEVDTVRLAWRHFAEDGSVRAEMRGEAPIVDGSFDIDALLASVGSDWEPPALGCESEYDQGRYEESDLDGPPAASETDTPFGIGDIVAMSTAVTDGAQLEEGDLHNGIMGRALDVAVVWSSADVERSSPTGERIESTLVEGLQLSRLRPCRLPSTCQGVEDASANGTREELQMCLGPWPSDGLVLLQPSSFDL